MRVVHALILTQLMGHEETGLSNYLRLMGHEETGLSNYLRSRLKWLALACHCCFKWAYWARHTTIGRKRLPTDVLTAQPGQPASGEKKTNVRERSSGRRGCFDN
jgi:hypothetical protein